MKPEDVTRLEALLSEALEASKRAMIVPVTREDGLVLQALAYVASSLATKPVIVEAGCGAGYSSLWIAAGMLGACGGNSECTLVLIDRRADVLATAESLVRRLVGSRLRIVARLGDALETLSEFRSPDMVFIDIEKRLYTDVLRVLSRIEPRLVVFHNAVYPPPPPGFYEALEEGWTWTLVPTGPGIIIARRRR